MISMSKIRMTTLSEPLPEQQTVDTALAIDCYRYAIRVVAQYAVELEREITEPHKEYLTALSAEVNGGEDGLRESRATLRGLLRDYRDKASQYIGHLREELASNARSLEEAIASLTMSGGDSTTTLRSAIKQLRDAGSLPAETLRDAIQAAAASVEESLDEMEKHHKVTVSQFQEEIRMLHKRIGSLEAAALIDSMTKLFNRTQMEERIREMDRESSVLLIQLEGLRRAESEFSVDVAHELAGAFIKRLRNCVPAAAVIGRWDHEQFLAILQVHQSEALTAASWIAENLSGAYVCMQKGKMVRPTLQLSTIAENHNDSAAGDLLARVDSFFAL
jgi:diguanylate cyclase (GGDEF)-like protein